MTKIKTARTAEGEKFYYLGHTQAVVDDNGNNIEDLLAEQEEKIELLNDNTGISDYPEFSTSKTYKTGTIVRHEGALFKFTSDHEPGIWDLEEVKSWNINAESQEKLSELGSELGLLIEKVGVSGLRVFSGDKITIDVSHLNTDNINRNYLSMFVYPFSLGNNKLNISNIGLYTFVADKDGYLAVEEVDAEIKYYATTSSYYLERFNEIDKKISKEEENVLKNLAKGGNFKDLNYWSSANGSVVERGLSLTDARNILLESKFTEDTFLGDFFSVLIDLESVTQNIQTLRFSFYKNAYINEVYFEVVGGRQVLCVQTNKNNMGDIDGGKIFLNITKGMPFNGIIHSIIVLRNVNSELAYELYKKYGFFERVKIVELSEFCINAPTLEAFNNVKDKVEYDISEHTHTIHTYLSGDFAEDVTKGIYVGTLNNRNALQRAIDSIPNDTEDYWTIYVEGNIKATSFSELSAADVFGRDYKSLVSLAGKRNISIIGINGQPKIEAELPDNDESVDYSLYQTLSLEGENIYIDNLFVSIKNGRYAVHYETNDSKIGDLFKNATVSCNRCTFIHQGNNGEAYNQWKSLYGLGIGFTKSPKLMFENCKFSYIGGHDGYNIESGFLSTINCKAEEWNFNQFGKERSRTSYKVVGCSYNKFVIRKTLNTEKIGYAHVDGYANDIKNIEYFDDNCKPNFSVSMKE